MLLWRWEQRGHSSGSQLFLSFSLSRARSISALFPSSFISWYGWSFIQLDKTNYSFMARGASGAVSRLQASQPRDMPFKRWILHRSSSSLCISDEQRSSCGLNPAVGSDIQMFHLTPTIPAEGNNTHDASGWDLCIKKITQTGYKQDPAFKWCEWNLLKDSTLQETIVLIDVLEKQNISCFLVLRIKISRQWSDDLNYSPH